VDSQAERWSSFPRQLLHYWIDLSTLTHLSGVGGHREVHYPWVVYLWILVPLYRSTFHFIGSLSPRSSYPPQNLTVYWPFYMYFQVDPYDIIGILLETLIYGAFLTLFSLSTVLLLHRRKLVLRESLGSPTKANSLLFYLVTSMMMFCTITAVSNTRLSSSVVSAHFLPCSEMVVLLAWSVPHSWACWRNSTTNTSPQSYGVSTQGGVYSIHSTIGWLYHCMLRDLFSLCSTV